MSQMMNDRGSVPAWTLADRIRKAREAVDMAQGELAEVTGISRQTLSNYEHGRTRASRANLNLIAMATGVDRTWLAVGDNLTPPDQASPGSSCYAPIVAA